MVRYRSGRRTERSKVGAATTARLVWIVGPCLPETEGMAQTAELATPTAARTLGGMTARWSDPHRRGPGGHRPTACIDRDGTIVRAIDPVKYAAWSQSDVASPNRKNPAIAAAAASGVKMNEWVHESIECSIGVVLAVMGVILGLIRRSRVNPV